MSILITGAGGFVGRHAIEFFLKNTDRPLFATDIVNPDPVKNDRVQYFDLDLLADEDVRSLVKKAHPRKVLHLAGISSVRDSIEEPQQTLETNLLSFINLVEAIRLESVSAKVLVISSSEVYGTPQDEDARRSEKAILKPETPYGASKAAIEMIARQYHHTYSIRTIIARPYNHTGPGQRESFVLSSFAKRLMEIKLLNREPVIYTGNIEVERDFLDVKDVVKAYHMLLEKGKPGEVYNVSSGKAQPLRWLLDEMIRITGLNVEIRVDLSLERNIDIPVLAGDNSKIMDEIGWKPEIEITETLKDLLVYWEKRLKGR
jgi:GDP-4-dehydro-6-deoxy-D-mannose reductase